MKKNRERREEEEDGERKSNKCLRKRMIENYREIALGWSRSLHSEAGGDTTADNSKRHAWDKSEVLTHVEGCSLCQPVRAL